MKKFLIAASALFLLAGATQAQTAQKDTKGEKHQRGSFGRHNGMQKLNLSDDQKKQMKELKDTYQKQFTDLRSNKSLSAEEIKTKSQALRKEQFEKMQSFLTAEQKAQIAAQKNDWSKGDRTRGFGGKAFGARGEKGFNRDGRGGADLKTKLGLTDDQAAKLKTSREGFREKVKAIRTDSKLSDAQKKEQVQALAKSHHESLKNVLTAEQLEKMKTGRKHRGGFNKGGSK
jgi:Spy/CpxP family protein refolding chaperone